MQTSSVSQAVIEMNSPSRLAGDEAEGDPHQLLSTVRGLYLRTVKRSVSGMLLKTSSLQVKAHTNLSELAELEYNASKRTEGLDWPRFGLSMVGLKRLDNIQYALEQVSVLLTA